MDSFSKKVQINNDVVLLHPSQLSNVKKEIVKELSKKKQKWNDELKGVVTGINEIKLLNGGKGLIKDDMPHLHYYVRYNVNYVQPEVGSKIKAKITGVQ